MRPATVIMGIVRFVALFYAACSVAPEAEAANNARLS